MCTGPNTRGGGPQTWPHNGITSGLFVKKEKNRKTDAWSLPPSRPPDILISGGGGEEGEDILISLVWGWPGHQEFQKLPEVV